MGDRVVLDGELSVDLRLDGELSVNLYMDGTPDKVIKVAEYDLPVYEGITEITPSNQTQILQTSNQVLTRNIVVNPIPEDYGRLLWSGNTLTVY